MFDVGRVPCPGSREPRLKIKAQKCVSLGGHSTATLYSVLAARDFLSRVAPTAVRSSVARTRGAAQHAHDAARDLFYITNTTHARKETRQRHDMTIPVCRTRLTIVPSEINFTI